MLSRDVEVNLFLLGALERDGMHGADGSRWFGVPDGNGGFDAVVFAGPRPAGTGRAGTAVPYGEAQACHLLGRALANMGGTFMVVGPRQASDSLWEGLGRTPDRVRYEQRLYVCDQPVTGPVLDLRPAALSEIAVLADMSIQMLAEDLAIDPRQIAPGPQVARVRERTRAGQIYVAQDGHRIVFKIDIGTWSSHGVQVGGTFVPSDLRRQGISTRAMRALCRILLERAPRVTLHVNEANVAAVRCYEAAGFRRAAPFRLIAI